MDKKKIAIVGISIVVVVGVAIFAAYKQKVDVTTSVQTEEKTTATSEPQKTDFGVNLPTDLPADIPVEKGAKVEQSYSLNYVGQKQLTIVFQSTKTVKENYALYADFLKKQNWNIVNKYESENISSLYGTKETSDINITISTDISTISTKSQVSISVLKK